MRRHALAASCAAHVALAVLLTWLPLRHAHPAAAPAARQSFEHLVWLDRAGPGGGGGGGGNRMTDPPRLAERRGRDRVTVPAAEPSLSTRPAVQPPVQPIAIPVQSLASAETLVPGALTAPATPTASQGPGADDGVGTGKRGGLGPGDGPGAGQGGPFGIGGGPYRPGGDVTPPIEIHRASPRYTSSAMLARVQGPVVVECVVQTDGVCTDIKVVQSPHPPFGLDLEAMKAASEWRFRPGTRGGEPVPVLVTIELTFTMR